MSIQIDHEVDVSTTEALDFEFTPPCEHSQHDVDPRTHNGPAAWARLPGTATCGCEYPMSYLCDKWVRHERTGAAMRCGYCGELTSGGTGFRLVPLSEVGR